MKMTEETKFYICSFCGDMMDPDEDIIIKGINGCICEYCIKDAMNVIEEYTISPETAECEDFEIDFKPSTIHNHLNEYVIGQDYAKQILSVAVYNHYKCLNYNNLEDKPIKINKSNILLIGPTGSGKTYLIKTLAKILDVPYAIADASTLTEAGYVGSDVETVLKKLLENADGNVALAEKGIVYIDEIDKLSRKEKGTHRTKDIGGEGVQQALLKMIEGTVVDVLTKGNKRNPVGDTIAIDTSNILFIFGGSFEGIEEIIKNRVNGKSGIGFGSNIQSIKKADFNDYILHVSETDLKEFGLIPEFIGRIPIICPLFELTEKELYRILTEPKNALIKQYEQLLKLDDVELKFQEEAISEIAKQSIKKKTGARGLRSILEKTMLPYMYNIPDNENIQKITITKEDIKNNDNPYKHMMMKIV